MIKAILLGSLIFASAAGAAPAQRPSAGDDPYAAASNHTLDMKPTGSHSRSRPLADLVAMGALTRKDQAQRVKSEGWQVPYSTAAR